MKDTSPAMKFLALVSQNQGYQMGRSWTRFAEGMHTALSLAIQYGLRFEPDDFVQIAELYFVCGEGFYTLACNPDRRYSRRRPCGLNRSACISFERWKQRKPFILNGRRLAVGAAFNWDGQRVVCTSFSEDGSYLNACSYKSGSGSKVHRRYKIRQADLREYHRARRRVMAEQRD